MAVIRPFTGSIFRRTGGSTSDSTMERFAKKDPLRINRVPFHWVDSLSTWHSEIEEYIPLHADVIIFQGTHDTVVDWKYNTRFLQQKLPLVKLVMIQGGMHSLQYESEKIRNIFYTRLGENIE